MMWLLIFKINVYFVLDGIVDVCCSSVGDQLWIKVVEDYWIELFVGEIGCDLFKLLGIELGVVVNIGFLFDDDDDKLVDVLLFFLLDLFNVLLLVDEDMFEDVMDVLQVVMFKVQCVYCDIIMDLVLKVLFEGFQNGKIGGVVLVYYNVQLVNYQVGLFCLV